jgi:hypothetical protein
MAIIPRILRTINRLVNFRYGWPAAVVLVFRIRVCIPAIITTWIVIIAPLCTIVAALRAIIWDLGAIISTLSDTRASRATRAASKLGHLPCNRGWGHSALAASVSEEEKCSQAGDDENEECDADTYAGFGTCTETSTSTATATATAAATATCGSTSVFN